jgi:hypothetical protein
MTIQEQVVLATDKVAHWNSKRDHALAMLTKWQNRLSALQAKEKPQPTAKMLPAVTLVADDKVVPIKRKVEKGQEAAQKALRLLGRNTTPLAISAGGVFHSPRKELPMYLFTKDGILSIVAHNKKPGMLMVRAAVRDDIEYFWPAAKIERTDDSRAR